MLKKAILFIVGLSFTTSSAFANLPISSTPETRISRFSKASFDSMEPWLITRLIDSGDRDSVVLLSIARQNLSDKGIVSPNATQVFQAAAELIKPNTLQADAGMGFFVLCFLAVMGGGAIYSNAQQAKLNYLAEKRSEDYRSSGNCSKKVSEIFGLNGVS